jgi:8-amino-7-oxononanoate synthase
VTTQQDLARYEAALDDLAHKSRLRTLVPRRGIDFTSNDYLGLASSTRLRTAVTAAIARGTPVGAGGSRLLRGNAPEHEALEAAAARFFRCERTLFFGSGYIANCAVLSTLPQSDDLIVLDALAHASANEGARAGRAQVVKVTHNDVQAVGAEIRAWRLRGGRGRAWIVVESLYSMDGDRAALDELIGLADRHDAMLYIDEAHATGVYGPQGRGLAASLEGRRNVLVLHTCSKALGGAGALVNGPSVLCDFLINRCRPFIYATAPSPLMAVAALEALNVLQDEPHRRERLARLVAFALETARARGMKMASDSQILPIIVGEDRRTVALATALQARGFDVRGVRPPTVPEGTARLRIAITLNVDEGAILELFDALMQEWQELAV